MRNTKNHSRAEKRAAKDLRDQVTAVREILSQVIVDHKPARPVRRLFTSEDLVTMKLWVERLAGSTRKLFISELERAEKFGEFREVATVPDLNQLQQLGEDFPNFKEVLDVVEQRFHLCSLTDDKTFRLPPMLLSGTPGVGKSEFSRRLAKLMNVHCVFIDMASLDAVFKINGLDSGYENGRPGLIWDALQNACMSPVVVLDEIEKVHTTSQSEGLGFLLALLETSTARVYQDSALRLQLDASRISWIATCNSPDEIPTPLRSRFAEFEIYKPSDEQHGKVIRSVHRDLLLQEDWGPKVDPALPIACLDAMRDLSAREIKKCIFDAYARAARDGRSKLKYEDFPTAQIQSKVRRMGFL